MVEREVDVLAGNLRAFVLHVDHLAAGILDDRLLAGAPCEVLVVLQLEAGEAVAVGADVAEHLRRDRLLRIGATLLGIEAEAGKLQPLQRERSRGIGLTRDVHEALGAIGKQRVEAVRVGAERPLDRECGLSRIHDLLRIRVDGRRALTESELDTDAVVDRAAARRKDDRLSMLRLAQRRQRFRAHRLQPGRTEQQPAEGEHQRGEKEADPPVD